MTKLPNKLPELKAMLDDPSLTAERRAEIQAAFDKRYAKLQKIREAAKVTHPHMFATLNPPQKRFFQMVQDGVTQRGHFDYAATFGVWVGKTTALGILVANITAPPQIRAEWFPALTVLSDWKYSKRIRIGCAPDQMDEVKGEVWLALQKWLPKDGSWKSTKAGKHYPSVIEFPGTGWVIDVKTWDQAGEGKESADIGLFLFDEPPPLDDWHRAAGRRKHGGLRMIFGSFIEDTGDQPALFEDIIGNPGVEHFFASTEENFKSNGGFLDDDITKQMMAAWDENSREARRTGRPNVMQSAVFKMQPDVHFVPRSTVPKELTSYLALDPHDVRPGVIVIGGWDKDGALWITGEWPNLQSHQKPYTSIQADDMGIKQYSELLHSLSRQYGVSLKIIDSNFADTKYHAENASTTLRRELWRHGRHQFVNGIKDVLGAAGGVARVRELLQVHDTPRGKRSKLYIVDDLTNCREQMTRLKRRRMKDELTGRVSDELEDRFLDYPRCIMYIAMQRAGYRPAARVDPQPMIYGHNQGADYERKLVEKWSSESNQTADEPEDAFAAVA